MATQTAALVVHNHGQIAITWENLANGDDGDPVSIPGRYTDLTVQVLGTPSVGGSVTIEGSNDGGTTWAALHDLQGNASTHTAVGIEPIAEHPLQLRPDVTAGDVSTDFTVIIVATER
jgi:hypothetical protein